MVPADDPLAAVDVPHAHLPVVDGHGVVRVELHACRACEWHPLGLGRFARVAGAAARHAAPHRRRVGSALGQVLEHVGAARVERAVHRVRVELGCAALPARHRRHARRVHVGQDGHPDIDEGDVTAWVARRGAQIALGRVGPHPEAEAVLGAERAHADQRVRAVLHDERARSHEVVHGAIAPTAWDPVGHMLGRHHGAVGGRDGDGVRPPSSGHGVPPILLDRAIGGVDGCTGVEEVEARRADAAGLEGRRLLLRVELVDVHLDSLERDERGDA